MLLKKKIYLLPNLYCTREQYKSFEVFGESSKLTPRRHFHRVYKMGLFKREYYVFKSSKYKN